MKEITVIALERLQKGSNVIQGSHTRDDDF